MEQRSAPARPLWDRIQAIRAERGWSWERLQRETGVSRTTLDKWKRQPRSPLAATVNTVARALGIDQEEALQLAGILTSPDEEPPDDALAELHAEVAELRRLNAEQAEANRELLRRLEEHAARQVNAKPTDDTSAQQFG